MTPTLRRKVSNVQMWQLGSCGDLKNITMSSNYTMANCPLNVENVTSIVRQEVPGALPT